MLDNNNITRISVAIPAEMAAMLNEAVEKGHYATTSEVVREALRDWGDKDFLRKKRQEDIRAAVMEGVADVEAGRVHDGETVFRELMAKYSKMAKERGML